MPSAYPPPPPTARGPLCERRRPRRSREAGLAVFRGIPFAEPPVGALRSPHRGRPRLGRGAGGARVRPAAPAGRPLRHGRAGAGSGGRRLADGQRLVARSRPRRRAAGAWCGSRAARYVIGTSEPPRVRRRPPRARRRRRRGDVQLPAWASRASRRSRARPPTGACSTRSPRWSGCATTSGRSAATRTGSRSSASRRAADRSPRCWRCRGRPGCSAGPSRRACPGTFFSPELAADIAAACAAELGLRPTVADLSAVDPAPAVRRGRRGRRRRSAERADRWGPPAHRSIPFAPVVDGDVLPATPWQALADGAGRDVDLLVGHTRDEHRLFTADRRAARPGDRGAGRDRPGRPRPRPGRRAPLPRGLPGGRARTSCTSWSTPTGCSACRRCTSPRRRPPPAAGPTSTS